MSYQTEALAAVATGAQNVLPLQHKQNIASTVQNVKKKTFEVSKFTAIKPDRLSKAFKINDQGELEKLPGGNMSAGVVERKAIKDINGLAYLLTQLQPNNALAFGGPEPERARVYHKNGKPPRKKDMPAITRTRENFRWLDGPGVLMLDYDPSEDGSELSRDGLEQALFSVCPELENTPRIWRPSASSCIYNSWTSEELRGVNGQRVYVLVQDASDISRAGDVLSKRLWLRGYGYIKISEAGSLLPRCLIDSAVWQPERLDFCGGAACSPPLEQRLPDPVVSNPDAEYLDTRTAIPDLTPAEKAEYERLVKEEKKRVEPEARRSREHWVEQQVQDGLRAQPNLTPQERDEHEAQLRRTFKMAVNNHSLGPDFLVTLESGETVTVKELLEQPEKHHDCRCADPLEPNYRGDWRISWIHLKNGRFFIYSHAHGGRRFRLYKKRKKIEIVDGARYEIVLTVLPVLREEGGVFDHGGELVQVRDGGTVIPLDQDKIQLLLDQLIAWERWDARSKKLVSKDCPTKIASGVLALRGAWGVPILKAVVTAPTMDPVNGRIIDADGYDQETSVMLVAGDMAQWPKIPDNPSKEDARRAVEALWRPFAEFPFTTALDRGVFLSFVLLTAIRPALPTAPGLLITAPSPGSGKTLLALCLAALCGADMPAVLPRPEKEDELRKRMLAAGRVNSPVILMDNVSGTLESDSLCAYLTAEYYSDRVLGLSETITVSTRSELITTGNNVHLQGDLCRRILASRVDAGREDPWNRRFNLDPQRYCKEQRLSLIGSILTVLRWAFASGVELPNRTGSFELWSDTVRRAVVMVGREGWLDVDDPVTSVDTSYTEDQDMNNLGELLRSWRAAFGEELMTVGEAVDEIFNMIERDQDPDEHYQSLRRALDQVAGESGGEVNARRLGKWLMMMRGRIANGLCFQPGGEKKHAKLWRVVRG